MSKTDIVDPLILLDDSIAAVDWRFVTHGIRPYAMAWNSDKREFSCSWGLSHTFKCPNCERRICYCAGHGDCDLCDECCDGTAHDNVSVEQHTGDYRR